MSAVDQTTSDNHGSLFCTVSTARRRGLGAPIWPSGRSNSRKQL